MSLISRVSFVVANYVIVPIMGVLICLLEAFGRIKFVHFERFPIWDGRLIIVSNHPSLLEPAVLPLMGFPWMNFPWVFSPLWTRVRFSPSWFRELQKEFSLQKKLIPANVPDRGNFYDPLYLRLFRGINVPVDRSGNTQRRIGTVLALKDILDGGGRVLLFPEGTRTFKAVRKSGLTSAGGKQMGRLKDGAAWLALSTRAKVLPVWVEGTDKVLPNNRLPLPRLWHKITIKIGTPFVVQGSTRQEGTSIIAQSLLKLADEAVNGASMAVSPKEQCRDKDVVDVPG